MMGNFATRSGTRPFRLNTAVGRVWRGSCGELRCQEEGSCPCPSAASVWSVSIAREEPEQIVFLAVFAFLFSCGSPNGQVRDVIDDISEGLPVSLVKHGLVDGWKASMVVLAHLVRLCCKLRGVFCCRQL